MIRLCLFGIFIFKDVFADQVYAFVFFAEHI